jgi:hypothetical protein
VLVLEDLHWSDYSTLDLLSMLARRSEAARLLVIGTYRPVEVVIQGHPLRRLKEDLELRGQCREIALEFLSESEVAAYLRIRLASESLPGGLAAFVHARTDGNPLFMVHVGDYLIERGALTAAAGGWTFAPERAAATALVPERAGDARGRQRGRLGIRNGGRRRRARRAARGRRGRAGEAWHGAVSW